MGSLDTVAKSPHNILGVYPVNFLSKLPVFQHNFSKEVKISDPYSLPDDMVDACTVFRFLVRISAHRSAVIQAVFDFLGHFEQIIRV
jgi:hypothetical protein